MNMTLKDYEEQAEKECIDNFGSIPEDKVSICDGCYKEVMEYLNDTRRSG